MKYISENGATTKKLKENMFKTTVKKSRKHRKNTPRKPKSVIFVIVKLE